MSSRAMAVAAIAVGLLIGALRPAEAVPCRCNNGNIDIAEPQCVCACFLGYLQPNCLYTAEMEVDVNVWVKVAPKDFHSQSLLYSLFWGLNLPSPKDVTFRYTFPTPPSINKTSAVVRMKGKYVQQLLWDVESQNQWVDAAKIEGAYDISTLSNSGSQEEDTSYVIWYSRDKNILITINTIAWFCAAIALAAILVLVDDLFFSNTEVEVFNAMSLEHEQRRLRLREQSTPRSRRTSPFSEFPQHETRQVQVASNPLKKGGGRGDIPQTRQYDDEDDYYIDS